MKKLVTEGGGTFGQPDYVTAAATSDGKVLLAYIPPAKRSSSITVDTALRDPTRAQWFDPTSGNYLEVQGNPIPNIGARSFKTPGKNSAGAGDWILLLQVF